LDPILRKGRPSGVTDHNSGKSDGGFLYAPVVIIALSLTIRPKFAVEYLRHSIRQGVGHFSWVKILGCSLWSKSVVLASAESEHHRLTNSEIIFGDFQPM